MSSRPNTFSQLPLSWQSTVKELREECKTYRRRLYDANSDNRRLRRRIAEVRNEAEDYRVRLRAAERRIAELEAGNRAE